MVDHDDDHSKKIDRLQKILRELKCVEACIPKYTDDNLLEALLCHLSNIHKNYYSDFFQTSEKKKKYRNICVHQLCKLLSNAAFLQESLHSCLVYFDFCWKIMEDDVSEDNIQLYTNVFVLIATKFHQVEYLRIDHSRWKDDEFLDKERLVLNHLGYRAHVVTYSRILELIHTHLCFSPSILRKLLSQVRIMAVNKETPQNIVTMTIELVLKCLIDDNDAQEKNTLQNAKRVKRMNDATEIV